METIRFTEQLFPTPIQGIILFGDDLIEVQKEMAEAISNISWVKRDDWGNTHWLSSANFDDTIYEHKLDKFKEVLNRELNTYCASLNFTPKPYKLTYWFSKFERGDFGHSHNHGAADISGCYYPQTNGNDGSIYFVNPNIAATSSLPYGVGNDQWIHQPAVGKMLMFPGWLYHGIKRNNTEDVRISFAFNVSFERP